MPNIGIVRSQIQRARCLHGVSTASRKILLPRALRDRGCAKGSSTAAERGMPDLVHYSISYRHELVASINQSGVRQAAA